MSAAGYDPVCWYCKGAPLRMTGQELFPDRADLMLRHYLVCRGCDAWVGCHPRTWTPYGQLANAALRHLRQRTHTVFDDFWRRAARHYQVDERVARSAAYLWLTRGLEGNAHIAGLDTEQCELVIAACGRRNDLSPQIRSVLSRNQRGSRPPPRR